MVIIYFVGKCRARRISLKSAQQGEEDEEEEEEGRQDSDGLRWGRGGKMEGDREGRDVERKRREEQSLIHQ